MNNNVETWIAPLAATNQYQEQYYSQYYTANKSYSSIMQRLNNMIETRDALDKLYKSGAIDEEEYKHILNNIRMQELKEDFE